jgi:hypothetical protein
MYITYRKMMWELQGRHSAQPSRRQYNVSGRKQDIPTFFSTPATKALVQVKGSCTMTQLDIRQPFGDYIQEGGIHANSCANQGDNQPGLTGIISLP